LGDTPVEVCFLSAKPANYRVAVTNAYQQTRRQRFVISLLYGRLTHFELDLWRTGWKVRVAVCQQLQDYWQTYEMPGCLKAKSKRQAIHGGFGPSFVRFDVLPERASYWRALLCNLFHTNTGLQCVSLPDNGS